MTKKTLAMGAALTLFGSLAAPGIADAGSTLVTTTVTIRTANGDFWGYVESPQPRNCAKGRKVILFKQKGRNQNPKNDKRVASDTASKNGDRFMWSTGNTGLSGKFYAKVVRTDLCKPDTSKTVRSNR